VPLFRVDSHDFLQSDSSSYIKRLDPKLYFAKDNVYYEIRSKVAEPHPIIADTNPSFHFNVDPDPTFHLNADQSVSCSSSE
jgi:hypothetical protein